jgi:Succinate dehydrogenase, hydrophobic anchor subunit
MNQSAVKAARRWYWQRITAMGMALFVVIHIAVMVYAMNGGLSASEILGRTQGSFLWALFYGVFVVLVSVHASIGLRNTLVEWLRMSGKAAGVLGNLIALLLLVLGLRAVWAVTFGSL